MNKTNIRLRLRHGSLKLKLGIFFAAGLLLLLLLAILSLAQNIVEPQTYLKQANSDTYTKYFFTRDECRYIFPEGSCVVDDGYCDMNSYDYQVISLEPHESYCKKGTIVYNKAQPVATPAKDNKQPVIIEDRPAGGDCEFIVDEGELVSLVPAGYDPDPDIGPAGRLIWTFYTPFNNDGKWQTKVGDAGITESKVKLSDGELSDLRTFCVEVIAINKAPILSPLSDVTVNEGDTVIVEPVCTDPDGDKVAVSITGYMTADTKNVGYAEDGSHDVTVRCTDPSGASDQDAFKVNVNDVNRAPTLDVPQEVVVAEGETARISAKVSDPDGDDVSVTFASPFSTAGDWKTRKGDAGTRDVKVTASDGVKTVTKTVKVIVTRVNSAPKIAGVADVTVYEGETIRLDPSVTDVDGDDVDVTVSGWMDGPVYTTTYDDAGEYDVRVTASDGVEEDSVDVHVTVLNRNRPPVITKIR